MIELATGPDQRERGKESPGQGPQGRGSNARPRAFSGIQSSGRLHIGNYLGAMRPQVALQETHDAFYAVVDYHALTSVHDASELRRLTREAALDYLAVGLDPEKSTVFRQSDVPLHTDLCWVLATVTPLSWCVHLPTFKDKKKDQAGDVNLGLLSYPVLQAADIIMYKAVAVPVGKDQVPHIEFAREVVRRFNSVYGETFPEPQAVLGAAPLVLGVDGTRKMSKSLKNHIEIFASREELHARVGMMVTDTEKIRRGDPGHPGRCNVFSLHRYFRPESAGTAQGTAQGAARDAGAEQGAGAEGGPGELAADLAEISAGCAGGKLGCVECKGHLAGVIDAHLAPLRERRAELAARPGRVDEILAACAARATRVAEATMDEVRAKTGLGRITRGG